MPPDGATLLQGLDGFMAYVQRFDVILQGNSNNRDLTPDLISGTISGMFSLRRSLRAVGSRQASIIQLKHVRKPLMLVPRFTKPVDPRLTRENCMEHYSEFWLNDYFDKETFYSFRLA